MITLRREQGRAGELRTLIDGLRGDGDRAAWHAAMALLECDLGRTGEARTEFDRLASSGFDTSDRDQDWIVTLAHLAETCANLRDANRVLALSQFLHPYAGHNVVNGVVCLGPADRYLGMLSAACRDWAAAERHFENALALCDVERQPIWLAHIQLDFAATLMAQHDDGKRERGTDLLDSAMAAATSLSLKRLGDNCLALLSRTSGEGPAIDGLSPGELRVLRLLASGASNRVIGEKLFLSSHTVANHVRNILAKTSSANRTEAANYARRHGLVPERLETEVR